MSMTIRETRPGESKISLRSKPGVNVNRTSAPSTAEEGKHAMAAGLRDEAGAGDGARSSMLRAMDEGMAGGLSGILLVDQARGLDEPRRGRQAADG
ncbi:MAG: hypothetical protein ACLTSG_13470 [Lachnospiraceae bacterium]